MGFFDRFFHPNTTNEPFVDSPMRDNWYQASSYWPSSFALITTVDAEGNTNIGPYQLTFPFEVIGGRSFIVCSRQNSNTETNIHQVKKCALNFVEFDKSWIKKIVRLGYPGQTTLEKMEDNPFTLIDSPTEGRAEDPLFPKILKEAFQVYECTLDSEQSIRDDGKTPEYMVLRIENTLLKKTWQENIENGTTRMPRMPIAYGFRDGHKFWFAEHKKPFWVPTPTDKGPKEESVLYEANRLEPDSVKFTRAACKQLTGVPKPFIKTVLKGIIKQAKADGVALVDEDYVKKINDERNS